MTTSDFKALKQVKGIGEKRYAKIVMKLREREMSLSDVFAMRALEIKSVFGLPINVAESLVGFGNPTDSKSSVADTVKSQITGQSNREQNGSERLKDKDIRVLHPTNDDYPARLKELLGDKAPDTLYVWGNLELFQKPSVGFCGSRNVSEKGLQVTADASEQLAKKDWVIVSGHARGVDSTAHKTALQHGAGTIIVLPQGINTFRLRSDLRPFAKRENILVVSEFEPDARWAVGRAMQRNRTIIGLSDAMILIESRTSGGTFNAGKTALSFRHPLFVANYQEDTETNAGNQYFLQRGAFRLLKNRETNRANLSQLFTVVNRHQPETKPQQLSLQIEEN